ncbi:MAG: hypothetical protein EA398_16490, partial [Deltaproteobacteria bacterium]
PHVAAVDRSECNHTRESNMSNKAELKSRVEAKVKQLEADLAQAKANAQGKSNDAAKNIEEKLSELKVHLGKSWDDFGEDVAERINRLLK